MRNNQPETKIEIRNGVPVKYVGEYVKDGIFAGELHWTSQNTLDRVARIEEQKRWGRKRNKY